METRFLIDTCTIIKYLQESFSHKSLLFLDEILDNECQISFITQIELLSRKTTNKSDYKILEDFINSSRIFYINNQIISKTVEIRKLTKVKIPDAMIAATAISNDFTLKIR